MNRTCPKCGDLNGAKAEHCTSCGAQLVLALTRQIVENIRTCRLCGKSLRGRDILARFCSDAHRRKHWALRHPRATRA